MNCRKILAAAVLAAAAPELRAAFAMKSVFARNDKEIVRIDLSEK